jgi:hypothetical protein
MEQINKNDIFFLKQDYNNIINYNINFKKNTKIFNFISKFK